MKTVWLQLLMTARALLTTCVFVYCHAPGFCGELPPRDTIRKVLPAEYEGFRTALVGDNSLNDARACLDLVAKTKRLVGEPPGTGHNRKDVIAAYSAAWCLCLELGKRTKDAASRSLVLEQWDASLEDSTPLVEAQLYALSDVWDRCFLTAAFWQLLRRTEEKTTISAVCYMIYTHGDNADTEKLVEKRKSLQNRDRQQIVQNALNWIVYRDLHDKNRPGPAAAPPRNELNLLK
jgi:hypothetical protein